MIRYIRTLFLTISILLVSYPVNSQELNHKILLRNHNAPGYGEATFLINSSVTNTGELVSLVRTVQIMDGLTEVKTPNQQFNVDQGQYALFQSDQNGEVVWRSVFSFNKLSADTLLDDASIQMMNKDDEDNYYITITSSGNVGVELDGSQILTLQSSRTTTLKIDANGQYLGVVRSKLFGGLPHRLLSIVTKNDLVYFLYSQFASNGDQGSECRLLRQFIEIRSSDGQLVKETVFTAKNVGTQGNDDICSNNTNISFLMENMDVDQDGNIYLSGHMRGPFPTTLSRSIIADSDEHLEVLVKLNSNFLFQWHRVLPTDRSSLNRFKVMPSGHVLLMLSVLNTQVFDFNKEGNTINTGNFEKLIPNRTISLSKIDPEGNLIWTNFFDRPIGFSADASNNEENIWIYVSTFPNRRSESFVYYDPEQNGHSLKNNKYPLSESQVGYLRLDENGEYIGHRFLSVLSNGVNDRMFPRLLPLNVDCKEFYIVGRFVGTADISFEQNVETITSESSGDWIIAKYANAPPTVIVDNNPNEQCPESMVMVPFVITDENVSNLKIEVFSSNEGILPNDSLSIVNENGAYYINISAGKNSGSFNVILRLTDECDIITEEEIPRVIRTPPPTPSILNTERNYNLCEFETVVLTASIDNPLWSNGETTKSITVSDPGLYWVNAVDSFGCKSVNSDTVDVFIFRTSVQPTITVSGELQLCEGESVTLTTNLDRNILWSNGETTPSISVSQSGIYTVRQTSQRCGDGVLSDPIEVIVHPIPEKPVIQVEGALGFCEGDKVKLTAPVSDGVRWSNGSKSQSIEVTQSGKYWLEIEANGCLSPVSDTLEIVVSPDFNLEVARERTLCTGFEEIELSTSVSDPSVSFLWSDGSDLSSLFVTETGEFWLEASNGVCRKDRVFIKVEHACHPRVFIPNAFTPNNDGINDLFEVKGASMTSFRIQIFNKWGAMIFSSNSISDQWDGTHNNQDAPAGNYTYNIIVTGEDTTGHTEFVRRGSFKLIR